jgi:hypothetical protein
MKKKRKGGRGGEGRLHVQEEEEYIQEFGIKTCRKKTTWKT